MYVISGSYEYVKLHRNTGITNIELMDTILKKKMNDIVIIVSLRLFCRSLSEICFKTNSISNK